MALTLLLSMLMAQRSPDPHWLYTGVRAEEPGSCMSATGPVALSRAVFIENRSLDWNQPHSPIRIHLREWWVDIEPIPYRDIMYPHNIASMVARGEDRADVNIKLALLDNVPVIYWRETFQHRAYRQGLFRIVGHELVSLCEGSGGQTILD